MADDFIPASDPLFNNWQANFVTFANGNLAALGLVAADMTPVTSAQSGWTTNYAKHLNAAVAALSAKQDKDTARAAYVAVIRALVRRLQASPAVSDGERASLGITVPDHTPTPSGPPTSKPLVMVDCSQRLMHTLSWVDAATPTKKAKPPGVLGVEIWVKVDGPPPLDETELEFVALDTATPYAAVYAGSQGGKTAHYMLRWVSGSGEKGPWSETVSVTIGA